MTKRIWIAVIGLAAVAIVGGAVTMFGWMVDETHFDRPSAGFDRLTTQVEALPGVSVDDAGRWVEAPAFWAPISHIGLTVDEANLPELLETACATEPGESISWSLSIETNGGAIVSVHGEPSGGCLDVGFDVAGFVAEAGRLVPGLDLQPTIWDDDQFALVALEDRPGSISTLLPLVDHADELLDAAGLGSTGSVEINSSALILAVQEGENDRYVALLTELVERHGVTNYWADGGGTPIDGVTKVQVTAPDREQGGIEAAIRASGLHVADLPVRFIPSNP